MIKPWLLGCLGVDKNLNDQFSALGLVQYFFTHSDTLACHVCERDSERRQEEGGQEDAACSSKLTISPFSPLFLCLLWVARKLLSQLAQLVHKSQCYNLENQPAKMRSHAGCTTASCNSAFKIQGNITNIIGNLTKLTTLYLCSNQLSRHTPQELGYPENVDLDLSNNTLTGSIPKHLGNITNISQLFLDNSPSCVFPKYCSQQLNLFKYC